MDPTDPFPLCSASVDVDLNICAIDGGRGMRSRLASMGMVPGVRVRLMRTRSDGPYIVGLKEARVMLGHGMACRILVRPALSPPAPAVEAASEPSTDSPGPG